MNREKVYQLRAALQTHLETFAKEHGIVAQVGNAALSQSNVTFKVEFAEIVEGIAETRDVQAFRTYAKVYGLMPEDLGRTFTDAGKTYKIVGALPKSTKYPIICEMGGQTLKVPSERVRRALYDK